MNLFEAILPLVLPIVAAQADAAAAEGTPEDVKRLGYTVICAVNEEALAKLAELPNSLPLAAFRAAHAQAIKEFEDAGIGDVPAKLDAFVSFAY